MANSARLHLKGALEAHVCTEENAKTSVQDSTVLALATTLVSVVNTSSTLAKKACVKMALHALIMEKVTLVNALPDSRERTAMKTLLTVKRTHAHHQLRALTCLADSIANVHSTLLVTTAERVR